MVADVFTALVDAFGKEVTEKELVPAFVKLLKDSEAEVRTAAASKVTGVASQVPLSLVTSEILPCVKDLSTDESRHVRSALASDIMGLAPLFGEEGTTSHLLDLYLQLLKVFSFSTSSFSPLIFRMNSLMFVSTLFPNSTKLRPLLAWRSSLFTSYPPSLSWLRIDSGEFAAPLSPTYLSSPNNLCAFPPPCPHFPIRFLILLGS